MQYEASSFRNRLSLESLEDRLALTATATFWPAPFGDSVLYITGDRANDRIQVTDNSSGGISITDFTTGTARPVSVFGVAPRLSNVRAIVVSDLGGNDTYLMDLTRFTGRITVYGGDGDDYLRSSSVGATLYGDGGNDLLEGSHRNDTLIGGQGDDILVGKGGNDTLFGDTGQGSGFGHGRDLLIGGTGIDTLRGDGGEDVLVPGQVGLENNNEYLRAVHLWWRNASLTYNQRIQGMLNGLNGYDSRTYTSSNLRLPRFDDRMVVTDADRDHMYGGAGMDFFWRNPNAPAASADSIYDHQLGEVIASAFRTPIPGEI